MALLLLAQFILFIGVGAVIPAIPLYGQEIGLSQAANGLVISAPAVALLLSAQAGGRFADIARQPAMRGGMALIVVADVGTALSTTLPALILARLALGAGRCVAESGERGLLADLAGTVPALRGRALAAQQAALALGIAVGAPLGGLVIAAYGPRAAFLCVSAGALVALILYTFLPETVRVPQKEERSRHPSSSSTPKEDTTSGAAVTQPGEWRTLLADPRWRGLAVCQSGSSFGFAAKIAIIPILATRTLPGGVAGAGALISIAGLSGLIGAPIGGWLTDRAGAKFTAVLSGVGSALCLLLIPAALGSSVDISDLHVSMPLIGSDLGSDAVAFVILVVLWSLGVSAQGPALTALAQELAPLGSEATALALPRATGDGTYIVAPFILGAVADSPMTGAGAECAVAGAAGLLGAMVLASSIANGGGDERQEDIM
jgi:MFS family permease